MYLQTPGGVELFYRDWGTGKPLLFLSGWTLNSDAWAYQMEPLSRQGFRCVAYDRRGHGRSDDPGGGYGFDTLADDLSAVLTSLDLRNVILVGHSFASGEMVRYLNRHGDSRVAGAVFVAPAAIPYLELAVDKAVFAQINAAIAQDFPGWAEANAEPYFGPGVAKAVVDWTLRLMTQTSLQAAVELNRIQTSTDFRTELAKIRVPALFLHGDRDASAPLALTSQPAAALVPGAELVVYEGAPHGLYFTHKARLNEDIAKFASA